VVPSVLRKTPTVMAPDCSLSQISSPVKINHVMRSHYTPYYYSSINQKFRLYTAYMVCINVKYTALTYIIYATGNGGS
jgi:hypothetical protein